MTKLFDDQGRLRTGLFDPRLLRESHDLREVLASVARTHSSRIESTHFLMTLSQSPFKVSRELFDSHGITDRELMRGLSSCARNDSEAGPPTRISPEVLDESARRVIADLERRLTEGQIEQIGERDLLLATLENLTPGVVDTLDAVQLNVRDLIADLTSVGPVKSPVPFDSQQLRLEAFTAGGRRVLGLMKNEAEALGYSRMDPRHLLLALVDVEGGALQMLLYEQDLLPRKVQGAVMLNLRDRARRTRSKLGFERGFLSSALVELIERAGEEAEADRCESIAGLHLVRAFLAGETFAARQLRQAGLDLRSAGESARRLRPEDEDVTGESGETRSREAIEADLRAALVGQDAAVELCLRFIRRMLFGLSRNGRPCGVFLFCGPSGSGKTEMAKAMARAVFGDEDHLIMLEMGQFQTKESMNIFVGAPPGYIGYGEGKLTRGLRDKPRSVVLFDEVEKAHPEVFDALLRFIDEGRIDDPAGPIRDGSESIIVLTSNIAVGGVEESPPKGESEKDRWRIRRQLKEALCRKPGTGSANHRETFRFRPEFLNRIDEVVLFRPLDANDLAAIARRHLQAYAEQLRRDKQIDLMYAPNPDSIAGLIGNFCAALDEGARAVLRVTQTAALDPVIDFLCERECTPPVSLVIHFPQNGSMDELHGLVEFRDV